MNPFIGQVIMFAGNFAPRGWAYCKGQLLNIAENTALFSILGTTYGGDGRTTFGLPDLQGRAPFQQGNGPGLSPTRLGQKSGSEKVALNATNIPSHNHTATLHAENAVATERNPKDNMLGANPANPIYAGVAAGNNKNMGSGSITISNTGSGTPHENMQPYAVSNYIIALVGTYPSRS